MGLGPLEERLLVIVGCSSLINREKESVAGKLRVIERLVLSSVWLGGVVCMYQIMRVTISNKVCCESCRLLLQFNSSLERAADRSLQQEAQESLDHTLPRESLP